MEHYFFAKRKKKKMREIQSKERNKKKEKPIYKIKYKTRRTRSCLIFHVKTRVNMICLIATMSLIFNIDQIFSWEIKNHNIAFMLGFLISSYIRYGCKSVTNCLKCFSGRQQKRYFVIYLFACYFSFKDKSLKIFFHRCQSCHSSQMF